MRRFKEERFSRLFSHLHFPGVPSEEIALTINGIDHWDHLVSRAHLQGTAPLFFHHLKTLSLLETIPPESRQRLEASYHQTMTDNLELAGEFEEVLGAASDAGIPVIALKGIWLADRIYPNIALRPMKDVDVLIFRKDLDDIVGHLESRGYEVLESAPMDLYKKSHFHIQVSRKGVGGPCVEIHWGLVLQKHVRNELETLWKNARPEMTATGMPYLALAPEDALWYQCLHAAVSYSVLRTVWLTDIVALVEHYHDEIDWDRFRRTLISRRTQAMTFLSLSLVRSVLGVDLFNETKLNLTIKPIQQLLLNRLGRHHRSLSRASIRKKSIQAVIQWLIIDRADERARYIRDRLQGRR